VLPDHSILHVIALSGGGALTSSHDGIQDVKVLTPPSTIADTKELTISFLITHFEIDGLVMFAPKMIHRSKSMINPSSVSV
jgi:hypothetical protein